MCQASSFEFAIEKSREASAEFFALSKPVLTQFCVNIFPANFEVRKAKL